MKPSQARYFSGSFMFLACLAFGLMTGCTVVGPNAIHTGRAAYNEAITRTSNQQMLKVILENRYGEPGGISVTADVSVTASSGIEAGVGSSSKYNGNLVPFNAGVVYEENPTISYVPVVGAAYAHRIMSPSNLAELAQFTGNLAT